MTVKMYSPSRIKKRTRARGPILPSELTKSPRAQAVRADILDRLRQHEDEDTLPRGGRGLFYDLRPHGMPDNPRGVTYTRLPNPFTSQTNRAYEYQNQITTL